MSKAKKDATQKLYEGQRGGVYYYLPDGKKKYIKKTKQKGGDPKTQFIEPIPIGTQPISHPLEIVEFTTPFREDIFTPTTPTQRINTILENIKFDNDNIWFMVNGVVPANATVLVLGDIHGTVLGLVNIINDWDTRGYIDKNTFRLTDNVYVVSLGDLIDYGNYSCRVLEVMLTLRRINGKERVMLLSGNHEGSTDIGVTGKDKFQAELNRIAPQRVTEILNITKYIGPSMLMLRFANDNGYYCMMHGMFPAISPINIDSSDNIPLSTVYMWPDYTNNTPIVSSNRDTPNFTDAVQWNDLSGKPETYTGQRGIDYSLRIGYELLKEIMNKYKIKAFIRGHQDTCPTEYGYTGINTTTNEEGEEIEPTENDVCPASIATKAKINLRNNVKTWECRENPPQNSCIKRIIIPGLSQELTTANIKKRVLTTSMAHEKGYAAPGGYIIIHGSEAARGGRKKTRVPSKGKK
jgi:hypothetical protein